MPNINLQWVSVLECILVMKGTYLLNDKAKTQWSWEVSDVSQSVCRQKKYLVESTEQWSPDNRSPGLPVDWVELVSKCIITQTKM